MKKVLMITFYFPPMGAGSAMRAAKFAKYFPRYGWEPYVLTPNPKSYYFRDESLFREVELAGVKIYRTNPHRSKSLIAGAKLLHIPNETSRKLIKNYKLLYSFPDAHKKWMKKAVKLGSSIIEKENIDIIYATAPPFSCFAVGYLLKQRFKIPLIVDYRDSWLDSSANFFPTPYHRFRNRKLEQEVIRVADEVLTVNRRIKEQIISEYDYLKHDDINIINFGFDEEDYADVDYKSVARKNKMRFTYAGTFFNLITPRYFLESLSIVFKRRPDLRTQIEACFLGPLSRENLKLIKKFNVSDVIYNPGYVNHDECIKYMLSSDVLWFMVGRGTGDQMLSPMKMSEYMGARKPILACVPDGAAKQLLRGYDAVKICEPDQPEEIANAVIEFHEQFTTRNMPSPNEELVDKFNVDKFTYQLVRYFEFLLDIHPEFEFRGKTVLKRSIGKR